MKQYTLIMIKLLCFLGLVACAVARDSAHADYVRNFVKQPEHGEYSQGIIEDALMDVPDLVRKYGYPIEVHNALTSDGYILELHRIPFGKGQSAGPRPVVFVNHGMFGSSADWVIAGPGKALAYILADAGYDVWLGNARGTYYSRRHIILNPDDTENLDFWRFSWEEIGLFDLPASIDRALAVSGQEKLHFLAHSQGGTTFYVLTTMRPEYNDKIISFQGMAPAVFNTQADREMLEIVAPYLGIAEIFLRQYGIAEMFPNHPMITDIGFKYCMDGSLSQYLCTTAFHAFGGYSPDMHNASLIPVVLGHTPAGASFRQIAHFGQLIASGQFRRYDYGTIQNLVTYGRTSPPAYDLSRSITPAYIYYGQNDISVAVEDLYLLHNSLPNSQGIFPVEHPQFNHIDFLYGTGAKELVYDRIIAAMRKY